MNEFKINESKSKDLAIKINSAIEEVDDSMSYKAFAGAVAIVLKDEYGKHNYDKFIDELTKELK